MLRSMCGIVGAIGAQGQRVDLTGALQAMRHRGPDGKGQSFEAPVNLAHARLSILDLTDAAATRTLVESCGGVAEAFAVLLELTFLPGREAVAGLPVTALGRV